MTGGFAGERRLPPGVVSVVYAEREETQGSGTRGTHSRRYTHVTGAAGVFICRWRREVVVSTAECVFGCRPTSVPGASRRRGTVWGIRGRATGTCPPRTRWLTLGQGWSRLRVRRLPGTTSRMDPERGAFTGTSGRPSTPVCPGRRRAGAGLSTGTRRRGGLRRGLDSRPDVVFLSPSLPDRTHPPDPVCTPWVVQCALGWVGLVRGGAGRPAGDAYGDEDPLFGTCEVGLPEVEQDFFSSFIEGF